MVKENFDKIISDLELRISMCEKHLGNITTKSELLQLQLCEFLKLKNFCQEEHSRMDKINSDFYHLIGMGNLTPIQTQKLCGLIRKYLVYRSDIKFIASVIITDYNFTFPTTSEYKTFLGNIKLESEIRAKN
jgi:hypothetical protein